MKIVFLVAIALLPNLLLGQAWTIQTSGTTNDLASVFFTDSANGWASGDRGLILHTTNGGTSWLPQANGALNFVYSIFFTDVMTGWAVENSGDILHTTNGGITWITQDTRPDGGYFGVFFIDRNAGWMVGGFDSIFHTTNGGTTWESQPSGVGWLDDIFFVGEHAGWAVGEGGVILHTTDGGMTWIRQRSATTEWLTAVFFTDAKTGWVVGGMGTILNTDDGGATWRSQTSGATDYLGDVHFINASTGWVVGWRGAILNTSDGGSTWLDQASGTSHYLSGVHFTDAHTGWAVGEGGTILHYSVDSSFATPPVSVVASVSPASGDGTFDLAIDLTNNTDNPQTVDIWVKAFDPHGEEKGSRTVYGKTPLGARSYSKTIAMQLGENSPQGDYTFIAYIGTYPNDVMDSSSVIYMKTTLEKGSLTAGEAIPEMSELSENYPNPFNPSTTFRYGLSKPGQVTLRVYNVLGKLVKTIIDEHQTEGYHEVGWDGKNEAGATVASGIYVYRLTTGDFVETKRMLLLK